MALGWGDLPSAHRGDALNCPWGWGNPGHARVAHDARSGSPERAIQPGRITAWHGRSGFSHSGFVGTARVMGAGDTRHY